MPAAEGNQATKVVGDLVTCLDSLMKNDSFDCLKKTFEENTQLMEENERLNTTNDMITKRYTAATNERDTLKKELEGIANMLHSKDKRNEELQRQCSDAKGQLEIASRELKAVKAQLEKLGAFAIKMERILPLSPLPKPNHGLHSMFLEARNLAEEFFGVDFSDPILEDTAAWERIRGHEAVRGIPLPKTNTTTAKQLRVAAVVAILSTELTQLIYRPVYLRGQAEEGLTEFLASLAVVDDEQETYLRSVLLRAAMKLPQHSAGSERVEQVSKTLLRLLVTVFDKPDHSKKFAATLRQFCGNSYNIWQGIQKFEEKVEPIREFYVEGADYWEAFSLSSKDRSTSTSATSNQKPHQNGSSSTPGGSSAKKNQTKPSSQTPTSTEHDFSTVVVWPAFVADEDVAPELLVRGHVLTNSQLQAGWEEEATRPAAISRRSTGRAARRGTMSGSEEAVNGSASVGSASKPFLSSKPGGGSRGG